MIDRAGESGTFDNRVAAWNRREATRRGREVRAWADRIARENPPETFTYRPDRTDAPPPSLGTDETSGHAKSVADAKRQFLKLGVERC